MRARAAAVLLASLVSCSVNLEGAACTGDDNCPGGQKCGYNGKCSSAAAACATPICRPGSQGCGSDGTIISCQPAPDGVCAGFKGSGGQPCGGGLTCGPGASCVAMFAVSLDAPSQGAVVGPSGALVQATVTLGSTAVGVPSTIDLLEALTPKTQLALISQTGLTAHYQGNYVPGSTGDGSVALTAVAAYGTADQTSSPAVTVVVDETPPVISGVTLACSDAPCRRDSLLTISASVTDLHPGPVTASVSLPAPVGAVAVALTATGTNYSGTLDLGGLSTFPFFSASASATFTAVDQVGNTSPNAATPPVIVTRLRWATAVESASAPSVTGAAVDAAGNSYVGGANGKLYVLSAGGVLTHAWQVGTSFVAAPALGMGGVWIGGQDTNVYLVSPATGGVLNGTGCATGGAITATTALAELASETAFVGSQGGLLFAVTASNCRNSNTYEPFFAAAAIDGLNNVYAASDQGRLRSLRLNASGFFVENWTVTPGYASVGTSVRTPLALAAAIWSASYETTGKIFSTTTGGTATPFASGGSLTDPILLSGGDVAVGDGNFLRRWNAAGMALWTNPPNLGAPVLSAIAIANGDSSFLVPTTDGKIHAIKSDGSVLWDGTLTAGPSLREANIFKLAGDTFSTAVFGAADGKVYAVLVDGQLDANSPWPKVHHDTRNTGNAASPLP